MKENSDGERAAATLRRMGLLWPENLTDDQLKRQMAVVDASTHPISARMLKDETLRRIVGRKAGRR